MALSTVAHNPSGAYISALTYTVSSVVVFLSGVVVDKLGRQPRSTSQTLSAIENG
ncbi:MAG: hypothetical protein ACU0CA_03915 [Paracoccaceae bacterium]